MSPMCIRAFVHFCIDEHDESSSVVEPLKHGESRCRARGDLLDVNGSADDVTGSVHHERESPSR